MNQYSEAHQNLEQQPSANQLLRCQKVIGKQFICTIQAATPTAPKQLEPKTGLPDIGSISLLFQWLTLFVVASTKLSNRVIALIGQKRDKKTKLTFRRKTRVKNNID